MSKHGWFLVDNEPKLLRTFENDDQRLAWNLTNNQDSDEDFIDVLTQCGAYFDKKLTKHK